jgi:hypothetical protein
MEQAKFGQLFSTTGKRSRNQKERWRNKEAWYTEVAFILLVQQFVLGMFLYMPVKYLKNN